MTTSHRREGSDQDGEQKPVEPASSLSLGKASVDAGEREPAETSGGCSGGINHRPREGSATLVATATEPSAHGKEVPKWLLLSPRVCGKRVNPLVRDN